MFLIDSPANCGLEIIIKKDHYVSKSMLCVPPCSHTIYSETDRGMQESTLLSGPSFLYKFAAVFFNRLLNLLLVTTFLLRAYYPIE